jgi:ADP-ribosylglycohydrolase
LKKKRFDPIDQLQRYTKWYKEGYFSSNGICFDIGITTLHSLEKFEKTHEPYCGSTDSLTSGNGSIMRLAAIPLFFSSNPVKAIFMSGESSKTTHGSILAIDACRYLGSIIVGIIQGKSKEEILSENNLISDYWNNNPLTKEIEIIRKGSFKELNPPEIKGDGFVVKSLEAALWAFYKSKSFSEGCLMAVNLGDDADTTGAVYGQIAGAFYGVENIPNSWRSKLAHLGLIESMAEKIFEESKKIGR